MTELPPGLPIAPQPPAPSRQRAGGGPLLLGCTLVVLLLLVASTVAVCSEDRLFRWGLGQTRSAVLAGLPEDATGAERARLEQAFSAVAEAVTSGEVDRAGMQSLRQALGEARSRIRGGTFDRARALALVGRLERIAGKRDEDPRVNSEEEEAR